MRTFSLAAPALLAACSAEKAPEPAPSSPPKTADAIACARSGEPLTPACSVETSRDEHGLTLTVRHPDGAFRRLLVATDGRGVLAADGAEPARVTIAAPGVIDVAIGDERYRLPATVKGTR